MSDADPRNALGEDLYDLATRLIGLAPILDGRRRTGAPHQSTRSLLTALYGSRRDLDRMFPRPAADIVLDLAIAALDDKTVSISSACIGSGMPMTTALRHIAALVERGTLMRTADPRDGRRANVRLSDSAMQMVEDWADRTRRRLSIDGQTGVSAGVSPLIARPNNG